MFPYFLLLTYFGLGALATPQASSEPRRGFQPIFLFGILLIVVMVGLRYRVGADWGNYLRIYQTFGRLSFESAVGRGEAGYMFFNWLGYQWRTGIWLPNLVCAAIFGFGLARLCRIQPNPMLAATIAIPYLTVVVAMGYTRQSAAIGFAMWAIADMIKRQSIIRFFFILALGALFHKSVVVVAAFVLMTGEKNRLLKGLVSAVLIVVLFQFFLQDSLDKYKTNYLDARYQSQGAAIRVAIDGLAAIIFFLMNKDMRFSVIERQLWRNFSIVSLIMLVALLVTPSSTAIDRLSLYLVPLQIAVFAQVPYVRGGRQGGVAGVVVYSALVLTVWLLFAVHARAWLPYRMIVFT